MNKFTDSNRRKRKHEQWATLWNIKKDINILHTMFVNQITINVIRDNSKSKASTVQDKRPQYKVIERKR